MCSNLPYLDVTDGLNRLGGNRTLYKRLLQSFMEKNNMSELRENMQTCNAAAAAKSAHALKGVTANLSIARLNKLIVSLEQELKMDNIPLEYLELLDEAFEGAAAEISQL